MLYESDEVDEEFVMRLNKNNHEYQLSLSDFEYVVDMLERIQGSEVPIFFLTDLLFLIVM